MKKNISINISGIIFHIEEDAYEKLRSYLDAINQYFSTFDDSQEIIADIESRIAEIFLAKLNEDKQIINQEDVDSLVATMGSIKDFKAVEDQTKEEPEDEKEEQEEHQWKDTQSKKLYRDERRKLLGGVCAGIAHYFNIDPLWIRLIFLILLLGSYGSVLIIYVIMWIVLPTSIDLSEDKKLKKMYRNPDGKVLGGVATGVAAYFGIDVAVVRLLFVISIFIGGTGFIAYIILWIILPEARSITDKVQMQGEPVTLSNIESNIKKSFKVKEGEEENIFVKILLFPFRLIAAIIRGLGSILGPLMLFLIDFIRVAVGVLMVFTGLVTIFALVVALGVMFGVLSSNYFHNPFILGDLGFPLDVMTNSFPVFTSIAAFFATIIPCVVFILLGISLVAKRIIFNATVGWSLFALFIISGLVLSVNIPAIVYKFKEDGEHQVEQAYELGEKTAVLTLREIGMEDYNVATLKLRGYEGPEYKLVQNFEAQGSSRLNAIENAKMVSYNVQLDDSVFVFDSNIQFKDKAIFRAQRLDMTLYIPYNKKFMMDEDLRHIIRNTIYRNGYEVWQMEDNTWMFNETGLECITCETTTRESERETVLENYDRQFNFSDFTDLEISSAFTVNIEQSDSFGIYIKGQSQYIEDINIHQDGNKLYIEYEDDVNLLRHLNDRDEIKIQINMPELNDLELSGASRIYLQDFRQREMAFSLSGASFVKANVDIDEVDIDMTGASEMEIEGKGNDLRAEVRGASYLNADNYEVRTGRVEAHGASSAKVYVTQELEIEETFASNVKYRGDANVTREKNGF